MAVERVRPLLGVQQLRRSLPPLGSSRPQLQATAASPSASTPPGAFPSRQGPPPLLLCYPNSGEQWEPEHRCWVPDSTGGSSPAGFAAQARAWVRAGAAAVGGCCRTGPQHIAELRRVLNGSNGGA